MDSPNFDLSDILNSPRVDDLLQGGEPAAPAALPSASGNMARLQAADQAASHPDRMQSALSIIAPLFAMGTALGGSPRSGAAFLGGAHASLQERERQQQIQAQRDEQNALASQRLAEQMAQHQAAQEAKRQAGIQSLIQGAFETVQGKSKEEYEQAIAFAENIGRDFYQMPPNRVRGAVPYRAPNAKKDLYAAVDKYLKHPVNKQALDSGAASRASIQVDTDGDGVPDKPVPLSQAISESGYPVFIDPETQKPILVTKPLKPENVEAFDEAYRGLIDTWTTDKGRPPTAAEKGKLAVEAQRSLDKPPAPVSGQTASDADAIADAIINGDQPPDLKGLYRMGPAVRAALAKKGYNLSDAQLDWQGATRHISTLNGPQQLRMRQAVDNAYHSLDVIEDLANQWKGGRFPILNRARLMAAKNGAFGAKANAIAVKLEAQIADVTSELGNVYMGGNSPTDHALGLASKNLSSDWSDGVLRSALDLARKNLTIRQNSMRNVGAVGSGENRYDQPGPAAAAQKTGGGPAIGSVVTLKNGQRVKIDTVNTDGTFTYTVVR